MFTETTNPNRFYQNQFEIVRIASDSSESHRNRQNHIEIVRIVSKSSEHIRKSSESHRNRQNRLEICQNHIEIVRIVSKSSENPRKSSESHRNRQNRLEIVRIVSKLSDADAAREPPALATQCCSLLCGHASATGCHRSNAAMTVALL